MIILAAKNLKQFLRKIDEDEERKGRLHAVTGGLYLVRNGNKGLMFAPSLDGLEWLTTLPTVEVLTYREVRGRRKKDVVVARDEAKHSVYTSVYDYEVSGKDPIACVFGPKDRVDIL